MLPGQNPNLENVIDTTYNNVPVPANNVAD